MKTNIEALVDRHAESMKNAIQRQNRNQRAIGEWEKTEYANIIATGLTPLFLSFVLVVMGVLLPSVFSFGLIVAGGVILAIMVLAQARFPDHISHGFLLLARKRGWKCYRTDQKAHATVARSRSAVFEAQRQAAEELEFVSQRLLEQGYSLDISVARGITLCRDGVPVIATGKTLGESVSDASWPRKPQFKPYGG